jgi:hypothetical protein
MISVFLWIVGEKMMASLAFSDFLLQLTEPKTGFSF